MYLFEKDFKRLITADNLEQIVRGNEVLRDDAEYAAIEEIRSYLIQKYEIDEEFTDSELYSRTEAYLANQRVVLSASPYSLLTTYNADDLVELNGKVYYSSGTTVGESPATATTVWNEIGAQNAYFSAKFPEARFDYDTDYNVNDVVFYQNKTYTATTNVSNIVPTNSKYWSVGTDYEIVAGSDLNDTDIWFAGDNRNKQFVTTLVDITLYHLHSAVSPRNIPDLRVKRYDDAIKYLKKCAMGDVTPNLIKKTPRQGGRIRMGYQTKNINTY